MSWSSATKSSVALLERAPSLAQAKARSPTACSNKETWLQPSNRRAIKTTTRGSSNRRINSGLSSELKIAVLEFSSKRMLLRGSKSSKERLV